MNEFRWGLLSVGQSYIDAVVIPAGSSEMISLEEGQKYCLFLLKGSVVVNREDRKKPWRQITGGRMSPILLATAGTYTIFASSNSIALRLERV